MVAQTAIQLPRSMNWVQALKTYLSLATWVKETRQSQMKELIYFKVRRKALARCFSLLYLNMKSLSHHTCQKQRYNTCNFWPLWWCRKLWRFTNFVRCLMSSWYKPKRSPKPESDKTLEFQRQPFGPCKSSQRCILAEFFQSPKLAKLSLCYGPSQAMHSKQAWETFSQEKLF